MASYNFEHQYRYQVTVDGVKATGDDDHATTVITDDSLDPHEQVSAFRTYQGETADGGMIVASTTFPGVYYYYTNLPTAPATMPNYTPMSYDAENPPCFVPGTLIATPNGARAVETLQIGDPLLTADGRVVAVKWIGHRRLHSAFAAISAALPIRITRGALGNGLPQRDLYVSPDHAMEVMGCLVHASALVNGSSITQCKDWHGDVQYFHVETDGHELILAEGAAAETFIDNDARQRFDNHAEFAERYPDAQPMVEMELPRVVFRRQLPKAISRHLEAIAAELMAKAA